MAQTETAYSILLIEDHLAFRLIMKEALEQHSKVSEIEEFSSLEKALLYLEDSTIEFDAILCDLGLPGMDGVQGIPKLRQLRPKTQILVLTAFADKQHVYDALNAGAHGYVLKSEDVSQTVKMLTEMLQGGTPLDPKIAGMLLRPFKRLNPTYERVQLSDREEAVLVLIAKGETRASAGYSLGLSKHTVDQYIRRIFEKLDVHSLPAAISAAHRQGLIDFSEKNN